MKKENERERIGKNSLRYNAAEKNAVRKNKMNRARIFATVCALAVAVYLWTLVGTALDESRRCECLVPTPRPQWHNDIGEEPLNLSCPLLSWTDVTQDRRSIVQDASGTETEVGLFAVTPEGRPIPMRKRAYPNASSIRVPPSPSQPGYSSVLVDTSGPNAVYGHNLCWYGQNVHAWRPVGSPLLVPIATRTRMETVPGGFHPTFWGRFIELESGAPVLLTAQGAVWHTETTMLLRPAYSRHISHFTEAVTTPVHMLRFPDTFPWAAETKLVFMPTFKGANELAWNVGFLDLILDMFPRGRPKLMRAEEAGGRIHCFERLIWVGCAGAWEWGNLFVDPWDAHILRRAAYAAHGVPAIETDVSHGTPARVLLIKRVAGNQGRRLLNAVDVEAHIKASGARVHSLPLLFINNSKEGALEKYSFGEQVRLLAQTDVLLGVHGSGLNNAIFMRPGSVVIDILPGRMMELVWHNTAVSAGVHYYFLFNERSSVSTNGKCQSHKCDSGLHYDNWANGACPYALSFLSFSLTLLSGLLNCDVIADLGQLDGLLRMASQVILYDKRARSLAPLQKPPPW